MRVGDVARRTGKTVRAIRLYEEIGLLQPATRSSGGFRLYEASAVDRVRWIDLLHGLGFSLPEMRELIRAWWGAGLGPDAMNRLRDLFGQKLVETREAVSRYQQLERELEEGLAYLQVCRECEAPAPPASGCVRCTQDHGTNVEPALVAGLTSAGPRPRSTGPGLVQIEADGR